MAVSVAHKHETDWADHFSWPVSAPQAIVGYVETCHARLRPRKNRAGRKRADSGPERRMRDRR